MCFKVVRNDSTLDAKWNDTRGVSNLERVYMLVSQTSLTGIGQKTIGNILTTISQESELKPMMYNRVNKVSLISLKSLFLLCKRLFIMIAEFQT